MDHPPDLIDELSNELMRAFRRLRRSERKELAPFGLTFGQARALRIVASRDGGLRIGELAAELEIVPRSATTMVDGLEEAGFVTRRPDPSDRRSVIVGCSEDGRALLTRLSRAQRTSAEQLFEGLSGEEARELLRLLRGSTADATAEEIA